MKAAFLLIILISSWDAHSAPAQDYLICKEGQQSWRGHCDNWCWCVGGIVLCDLCYVDFTFTENLHGTPEENGLSTVLVAPTAFSEHVQLAVADKVVAYKQTPQLNLLYAVDAAVDAEDYYKMRSQLKAIGQSAENYRTNTLVTEISKAKDTFDIKTPELLIEHMNALHSSNDTVATDNFEPDFIEPVPVAQSKPANLYQNTLFYSHLVKERRLNSSVSDVHVSEVVSDEEVPLTSDIEERRLEMLQLFINVLQDLRTNYSLEGISLNVYPNVRSINIDNVQLIDRGDSNETDFHYYDLEHPNDISDDYFTNDVYDYDNSVYLSMIDAPDSFISRTAAKPFNSTVQKSITLQDLLDVMKASVIVAQNGTKTVSQEVDAQTKPLTADSNYIESFIDLQGRTASGTDSNDFLQTLEEFNSPDDLTPTTSSITLKNVKDIPPKMYSLKDKVSSKKVSRDDCDGYELFVEEDYQRCRTPLIVVAPNPVSHSARRRRNARL